MRNVIIVANVWGAVPRNAGRILRNIAEDRESRFPRIPRILSEITSDGGLRMAHYYNTTQSAHFIIRMITKNYRRMCLQRSRMSGCNYIVDAGPGQAANRKLKERIRHHEADLERIQEGMVKTFMEMDEKAAQKLRDRVIHHQSEVNGVRKQMMEVLKGMDEETRWGVEEYIEQYLCGLKEVGEEMNEVLRNMCWTTKEDLEDHVARLPRVTLKKTLEESLKGPEELERVIDNFYTKWEGTPEEMMEMLEKTGKEARKYLEEGTERCRAEAEVSLEKMMETLREMGKETMKELEERVRFILHPS